MESDSTVFINIPLNIMSTMAMNREEWRNLLKKTRAHKGLSSNDDDDDDVMFTAGNIVQCIIIYINFHN